MRKVVFVMVSFLFLACSQENSKQEEVGKKEIKASGDTVKKQDSIASVKIGDQVWMANDLQTTTYRNGDPILNILDSNRWSGITEGAYAKYDGSDAILYNWFAVEDERGLCPEGWHVPSMNDWAILSETIGGDSLSGAVLKDSTQWPKEYINVNEYYGFKAKPSGYRLADGAFLNNDKIVIYWSSDQGGDEANAKDRFIISKSRILGQSEYGKNSGFSCRCIQD